MTSRLKTGLTVSTIAMALLVAISWSYSHLAQSRASESAAGQDLTDCRQLIARIESLRGRPAVAGAQELGAADLSRRIEQAARAADFAEGSILRIEPEPVRRIDETNYREVPTLLQMHRVTLRQMFTFFHTLSAGSSGLGVRDISLSAPRGEETGDRWTIEATLSYIVYSPKVTDPSAGTSSSAMVEN